MIVIIVCFVLVAAGIFAIVKWGGLAFNAPPAPGNAEERPAVGYLFRRLLWFMAIGATSGVGAGLLASGPGGRLVMRLLAATAGPAAQGRLTEAHEVVGKITPGGTIGLLIFGGIATGILASIVYMLFRPWLPAKRTGGALLGLLLLVAAATRLDPLRPGNRDFHLLGRPLLAVTVFCALAIFHGMVLTALAARLSQNLPLLPSPKAIPAHLPLVIFILPIIGGVGALIGVPILAAIVALSLTVPRSPQMMSLLRDKKTLVAGRVVLAAGGLAFLPGFISDISELFSRA